MKIKHKNTYISNTHNKNEHRQMPFFIYILQFLTKSDVQKNNIYIYFFDLEFFIFYFY